MNKHQLKNPPRGYRLLATTLLLLLLSISLFSHPASPQTYTDEDLFEKGLSSYNNQAWLDAAVYLYAYVQRSPQALSDNAHAKQVSDAYNYCLERIKGAFTDRDRFKAQLEAQAAAGLGRTTIGLTLPPPALDKPAPKAQTPEVKTKRCDIYGRIAVTQNELNLKHSCGFSGARWMSDYDFHFNWCVATSDNAPDSETAERQKLLNRCADGPLRTMMRRGVVRP
jgi:hypothetical protein